MFADAGCGDCHTMKAANATGKVGPDLDELKPNEETVVRQVTNGGNGMPAFKNELTTTEIQQVAAFVATAAGAGSAGKISFEPDDKKVEDCGQDAACFEQAFGNLAYEEGPGAALEKLAEMQQLESGRLEAAAIRSRTRSAPAVSFTSKATSAKPSQTGTAPAAQASTTAFCSGSSPVREPTRSQESRPASATPQRSRPTRSSTTSATTASATG